MKFKSFVMPRRVQCDKDNLSQTFGRFIVEPLERGYGTTLGNSLRRVMLSSIQGAAIKAVTAYMREMLCHGAVLQEKIR